MNLYTVIFYQPLLNLLVGLYNLLPGKDFGWSIVALTIIIKIVLWPLSGKSLKSQKALQDLQPKVDEVKQKYKDNKEELGRAMMNLYRAEKVSPFSSCLPLLVQFPFLIAIFQVLRDGIHKGNLDKLYPFVHAPQTINTAFLGIFSLSKPSLALAAAAGVFQFLQTRMLTHKPQPKIPGAKDEDMTSMMNKQMMYFMPILTVFIGASLPGGLALYWLFNTLITLAQQMFVLRHPKTKEAVIN